MTVVYLSLSILLLFSTSCLAVPENENGMARKDAAIDQGDMKYEDVDLYGAMAVCNDSFRIPDGYLQALNESGSFPDETEKTPKCYVRCLLEKTSVASLDGVYDPARTAMVFEEMRKGKREEIEAVAKTCVDRKEACKCERAYAYIKCLIQKEIEKMTET